MLLPATTMERSMRENLLKESEKVTVLTGTSMGMYTLDSGKRTKSMDLELLTMLAKASIRDSLKMEEDMEKESLSM